MKNLKIETIGKIYSDRKGTAIGKYREYSVLVPFIEKDNELFLLLEQRAGALEDGPGEICFPGGRVESGETPEVAAIRETEEEIGIPREDIKILGEPDKLYTFKNSIIYAVIGALEAESLEKLDASPAEVSEVFLAPFDFFMDNEPFVHTGRLEPDRSGFPYALAGIDESYPWDTGKSEVPVYKALPNGKIVWGLTANIIRHIVEVIKENA